MIDLFLHNELVRTLGWTILHSLWQATLLAGVLLMVSRLTTDAVLRYRLAYGTLLAQVVVSGLTFFWLYQPVLGGKESIVTANIFSGSATAMSEQSWWQPGVFLSWVVVFWLVGLVIGTTRLAVSLGRVRGMQRDAEQAVPEQFLSLVIRLANQIGYRGPLRLGISELLGGPALVGHLKPMLLFPLAVINQLTPEQAEAVILHELAHLQRNDHWWNLLQCIFEVIFYYHPVVWWIGARIREEREHCCDDLVLRHGPDRLAYARALLFFEQQNAAPTTVVALTNKPTGLLSRVKRFLHQQNLPYQMKSRLFLLPLFAIIALVSTAVYAPTLAASASATVSASSSASAIVSASSSASTTATSTAATDRALSTAPAPAAAPENATKSITPIQIDSLPRGRHQVSSYRNGSSTKVLVEGQAIKELQIDGRVVPESEYDAYLPKVEQLLGTAENGEHHSSGYSTQIHIDSDDFDGLEDRFEAFGLRWEAFGESLGEAGERLGERFENLFDGESGSFHFDSEGDQDGIFRFDLDSLPSGNDFEYEDGDGRKVIIRRSGSSYSVDDLLEDVERERSGTTPEDEIREMETMIQRLERRKSQMKRDLERERADGERTEQDKIRAEQRAMRNNQIAVREAQRSAREAQRSTDDIRRDAQRIARDARRIAEEARSVSPDYEAIVDQLQKEGLIANDGPMRKMNIDGEKMKINGKKASDAAYKRFLELHEARTGRAFGKQSKVTIRNGGS